MPDIFTSDQEKQAEHVQKNAEQPAQNQPEIKLEPQVEANESSLKPDSTKEIAQPLRQNKTFSSLQNAEKHVTEILESQAKSVGLFSHYCENPKGIAFINQEENETILLFLRRHFITNVPWLIVFFFLLIFPIIIFALFQISNFTLFSIPTSLVIILLVFYYMIVFNFALLNFIDWFYDIGILTRKRLLDLDSENILQHHMAETEVIAIVDVTYEQRGFFQSFFNYGNIHIQTEAIKANFAFEAAPKPAEASDVISDLKVVTKGAE